MSRLLLHTQQQPTHEGQLQLSFSSPTPMTRDRNPLPSRLNPVLLGIVAMLMTLSVASAQGKAPSRSGDVSVGTMHDVISEQALQKQVEGASKLDTALSARTSPVGEVRPSSGNSLLSSSIVLFDGQMFTLVPVGSVLRLPQAHRNKVLEEPKGEFTFWPAFLERNASWLSAREVPLKMAKGDAKIAEAILRETSADRRVVVSVYKGGPITILEPEPAETTKAAKR